MPAQYFLFPLGAVLIWAGNMTVNKLAVGTISPGAIALYRWMLAVALLTPFALPRVWRHREQIRPLLGKLAMLGILGLAAWQGLAYFAALHTTATNMGIIAALLPAVTMLLSVPLLRERPSLGMIAGSTLAFCGLIILVSRGQPASLLHTGVNAGDLLMVMACFCYGLYSVLLRRWNVQLDPWTALYIQAVFATVALVPGYLLGEQSAITADNIGLILYAAVPASLVSTYLWMSAVRHLGASRSSVFLNLMPPLAAAIAAVVLHERLAGYHYLGGSIAIVGVALSQWLSRPRRAGR